ncbi:nucleotidyltransferase family protein [Nitrospina sp. 32_T5]|uniref:nucleotidyltransferase family protein n=1 Tax=unclassified Nitrospina TaxID=2638683 RepID=UPI003F9C63DE
MDVPYQYKQFDAVVVAGEGLHSYQVLHQHKAFLEIENRSVVSYVIDALLNARTVRNIYVVGKKKELREHLRRDGIDFNHPKTITLLEQKQSLYENVWFAYMESLPEPVPESHLENSIHKDKAILVVPCDSPLITPHEIDYFIAHADTDNFDYVLGLTPEKAMRPFYPKKGQPGIKMAYLHLREDKFRINNMHLVKPGRIENRHYIQTMYRYRYQRDIKNVVRFSIELFKKDCYRGYRFYLCLLVCLMCARLKLDRVADWVRRWVPKRHLEGWVSKGLKTRFMGLVTPFPGTTLDIDNNRDFEVMKLRFRDWRQYLRGLVERYPLPEELSPHTAMPRVPVPSRMEASGKDTETVR